MLKHRASKVTLNLRKTEKHISESQSFSMDLLKMIKNKNIKVISDPSQYINEDIQHIKSKNKIYRNTESKSPVSLTENKSGMLKK